MQKPPSNPDAERTILGAVLLKPDALTICDCEGLRAEHFALESHSRIYQTLQKMAAASRPIDHLLLCEQLDAESVGGHAYLCQLSDGVVLEPKHIAERCRIVRRKYQLRCVLNIAEKADKSARAIGADPEQIVSDFTRELLEVPAK